MTSDLRGVGALWCRRSPREFRSTSIVVDRQGRRALVVGPVLGGHEEQLRENVMHKIDQNVSRGWLRSMTQMRWHRGQSLKAAISSQTAERLIKAGKDREIYSSVKRHGVSLADAIKRVQQIVAVKPRSAAPTRSAPPRANVELVTTPHPVEDSGGWDRAIAKVNAEFGVSPR
ncbi:hypothetical protein ABIB82_004055 [Bradyrhizobium sp. i1.8.4]|uniref:hypothetical protein n=1 Tax=unclassified Bradyrhizobium TaxID=2631580 RepID=UPI003D254CC8